MNNLLDFEEFINEWKNIEVIINDDDSITVNKDGKFSHNIPVNDKDNKRLLTLFSDNRKLIKSITGLSDRDDFLDNFLKDEIINPIKELKENSNKIFPENHDENKEFTFIKMNDTSDLEKIFTLVPSSSKDIGKGEVLMSCYYKNVNRLLITSQGGLLGGDCYYYDIKKQEPDENITYDGYIEVKSGGCAFRKLSSYIDRKLYTKLTKDIVDINNDKITIDKQLNFNIDSDEDYIAGLALRFLKYKDYANSKFKESNRPLYITFFDNEYNGKNKANTKITGYLQILIKFEDSIIDIYNKIKNNCIFEYDETKGSKGSRDFTVSVTNKPKIIIHRFKK